MGRNGRPHASIRPRSSIRLQHHNNCNNSNKQQRLQRLLLLWVVCSFNKSTTPAAWPTRFNVRRQQDAARRRWTCPGGTGSAPPANPPSSVVVDAAHCKGRGSWSDHKPPPGILCCTTVRHDPFFVFSSVSSPEPLKSRGWVACPPLHGRLALVLP